MKAISEVVGVWGRELGTFKKKNTEAIDRLTVHLEAIFQEARNHGIVVSSLRQNDPSLLHSVVPISPSQQWGT